MTSNSKRRVLAIAAMDEGRAIGFEGALPWDAPGDLKRFAKLTKGNTVLMGRKTWEALPATARPLSGRLNVVVTKDPARIDTSSGAIAVQSAQEFIDSFRQGKVGQGDILWVIGGAQIYELTRAAWDGVFLTIVAGKYPGDAWMPKFEDRFGEPEIEVHDGFSYLTY